MICMVVGSATTRDVRDILWYLRNFVIILPYHRVHPIQFQHNHDGLYLPRYYKGCYAKNRYQGQGPVITITVSVRCNYLSLSMKTVSGTTLLNYYPSWCNHLTYPYLALFLRVAALVIWLDEITLTDMDKISQCQTIEKHNKAGRCA